MYSISKAVRVDGFERRFHVTYSVLHCIFLFVAKTCHLTALRQFHRDKDVMLHPAL